MCCGCSRQDHRAGATNTARASHQRHSGGRDETSAEYVQMLGSQPAGHRGPCAIRRGETRPSGGGRPTPRDTARSVSKDRTLTATRSQRRGPSADPRLRPSPAAAPGFSHRRPPSRQTPGPPRPGRPHPDPPDRPLRTDSPPSAGPPSQSTHQDHFSQDDSRPHENAIKDVLFIPIASKVWVVSIYTGSYR